MRMKNLLQTHDTYYLFLKTYLVDESAEKHENVNGSDRQHPHDME